MWGAKGGCPPTNKDCNFEVKPVRYKDVFQTAKYILKNEGIHAFSKGIMPRMCINVPSTALSWGTYELAKSYLTERYKD
jgi:hypothetical protein